MILKTWAELERGRAIELARAIDVPPSFVSKMLSGEKPIPIAHMAAIEAYTKGEVTRQEMCPDRWRHIWPELSPPGEAPANARREIDRPNGFPAIEGV